MHKNKREGVQRYGICAGLIALIYFLLGCRPSSIAEQPSNMVATYLTPRPALFAGYSVMGEPIADQTGVYFCGGYGWDKNMQLISLNNQGQERWKINIGETCKSIMIAESYVAIDQIN